MNTNGIGLGLHICQQITEVFGGKIWVESEVDKGTTFTFTLHIANEETGLSIFY